MDIVEELMQDAERRMKTTVKTTMDDFAVIRTGRASASILNKVSVDYYGEKTSIVQLASIAVPEPNMILINPYDKSSIQEIERAILQSDLGLNPSVDGNVIRLIIPPLTEERRKDLIKMVKKRGEDAKIAARNIRREVIENLREFKKESEITEDDLRIAEKDAQKLTDKYTAEIDIMIGNKEKELMEV